MESITISNWGHLEHFGIKVLTGEACVYMMRLLCDVNEDGRHSILDYFSLPVDTVLVGPWNAQVNGKPSVGCIMLHRDCLPVLAEFLLRRAGVKALIRSPSPGTVIGLFTDERVTQYEKLVNDWPDTTRNWQLQRISPNAHPSIGSRNIHAATGRVL